MICPTDHKHAQTRTRRLAAANGYAPPAAWDDIDDPAEESKGVAA